jgi:hypothetical protein
VSLEGFSERGHRIVACGVRDDAQLVITRAQARSSRIKTEARITRTAPLHPGPPGIVASDSAT